ncbi:DMT family transporter [Desulfitobacterium chlororespirans]|uniref:Transporter family-2 protein n=1 Tax=Desulfitobacterium chlororespirans DSM 11544 TaxID=1121395 RepID=A0A1M7UHI2_9FIRM|nr:DMT family transporter [Desulfitobacterium chlororespirans]SHN82327.1 transporter family-2 protein [Desulfitobacterium chlororespirans DSM 11544]
MNKFLSLPAVIAAISGITMAIQGTLNSQLYQKTSILAATLVVHIIGTVLALIAVMVARVPLLEYNWLSIPWYLYLGGILSVVIVGLVALSIPKIGVCNATTAIIIGQVGAALIIDHLGLFGAERLAWNPWQFLGLLFFAAGAKLLFS